MDEKENVKEDVILYSHMKTKRNPEQEELMGTYEGYLCPTCSQHFFMGNDFVKHVNERHSQTMDSDGDQTKTGPIQTESDVIACPHIKTEMKTEQEELLGICGGFLCPICSKHFFVEDDFVKHINEHHSKRNASEDDTNKLAQSSSGLRLPSVSHKIKDTRPSGVLFMPNVMMRKTESPNGAVRKSVLQNHARTQHIGKQTFKCPDCPYATTYRCNLLTHSRTHSGEKPFKCPDCPYAAAEKGTLLKHNTIHTRKRSFNFIYCSYGPSINDRLKIQYRKDTGEKPFKCPDCPYAAAEKSTLLTHSRIHSGEKPFKCPDCPYAAGQRTQLRRHSKTHVAIS